MDKKGPLVTGRSGTMKRDVQLRVSPVELKFCDAIVGRVYRLPLTVHNIGRWNVRIQFQEPLKPQFRLVLKNFEKELASGLYMTFMVEYHPDTAEDVFDQIIISAGDKTIEVPLMGLIPCCQLEVDSEVDFGTLVANSKVHCKEITIRNYGICPGAFFTEYTGSLPIFLFPSSGVVQANSSLIIKVDFCADQPQLVKEVVRVCMQGRTEAILNIRAFVVEQIIELLNMSSDRHLDCIRFGSVFFGTSQIERALLYNNSPEPINWVAILQENAVGEELGTNIRQRTDVALNNLTYITIAKNIDSTSFISCVPNDGVLYAYEKTEIAFCFSPKLIENKKYDVDASHRQDYAVFLRFESVGSRSGGLNGDDNKTDTNNQYQKALEVALTGSGLPVSLHIEPGQVFNFSPCVMGECSEKLCIIQNQCTLLPVVYQFQRTAHFKFFPERGKIDEGCAQNVTCSFTPHQVGSFKVKQIIEIIGLVADKNFQTLSMRPFHYVQLDFHSVCKPCIKKVVMKINPGLSPRVTNPTGQFVVEDKEKCKAPVAMLQSAKTQIHNHKARKETMRDALIAFPNDRAGSIRPGEQSTDFRTIFTKVPRYNYVDPEYAYNKIEELQKKIDEHYYEQYLKEMGCIRLRKHIVSEPMYSHDDPNMGLQPGSGLKSPVLSLADIGEDTSSAELNNDKLLRTRNVALKEAESLRQIFDGLKSKPSTPQEIQDCKLNLTPKQIHQVLVGPSVLNLGDVCIHSTNPYPLHVINMLPMHILMQLNINLEELQKTKQLAYVIPPTTSTYISIIFKSSILGKFCKSFTFTVNNIPGGHILMMAVVQPVKLELSSKELVLKQHGFSVKESFKGTVCIHNPQNYLAKFTWQPVNKEKKVAFIVCPSKGTIDPFSSLECEIAWQPSFSSPEKGELVLQVCDGNDVTLKCTAQVGHTKVVFLDSHIFFNNSPQGLTSWKKTVLHNVGRNHAFFKVCDQNLLPTIKIIPSEGIIPFGQLTVLNVSCTPTVAEQFDTRAKIAIRRAHVMDLRIGGSVEIADVEISPNVFNFYGAYVGGTQIIPFLIKNKGITRARVEFNLQEFEDFTMELKNKSAEIEDSGVPDIYSWELEEKTTLECGLAFSPKEVATREFTFQVRVNFMDASENYIKVHSSSSQSISKTEPLISPCYVQATALPSPVILSTTDISFEIPLHIVELTKKTTRTQEILLHNISKKDIQWHLDLSDTGKLFKDGTFKFSAVTGHLQPKEKYSISIYFSPKCHRKYSVAIPIRLNDNPVNYRIFNITGEVKSPKLLFDPPFVLFTPVPLGITTVVDINILPQNYFRNSSIHVQFPSEIMDGHVSPLCVKFPKGKVIAGSRNGVNTKVTCHMSFKSSKTMSFFTSVLFYDDNKNCFSLPVTATTENCLLTTYLYMADHLDSQKIVIKSDKDGSMKIKSSVPLPSPVASKVTSFTTKANDSEPVRRKFFIGMEISFEHLKLEKIETLRRQDDGSLIKERRSMQSFIPEEGTRAFDFFQKVVDATETWFSLFGWLQGPHSISIPESVRRDLYKIPIFQTEPLQKTSKQKDFAKYNRTIYDMLLNLSGKLLPGVNSTQSLPVDKTERLMQLHLQHTSLLNFLNAQGACIAHVLPEFLLEPEDYKKWIEIASSDTRPSTSGAPKETNRLTIDITDFEALSKRAWTDVLLQIYKVLILSRVAPHSSKATPPIQVQNTSKINPWFVSSNVYSAAERILLSWLNTNYENTRHAVWKNCRTGIIPPEKWIVNFDKDLLDGLVLAAQMAAYCPFLIDSRFIYMYTQPKGPEQHLHNCLIIVNAFRDIGFDMDTQAYDIYHPNPVLMLMLCVYLYERLPTYLPRKVVLFQCTLHETVTRQILLKNPSTKHLAYRAFIVGKDATDFALCKTGKVVTISPKKQINIMVKFTSRFLHPAEATLLLISKSKHAVEGITMSFTLRGEVLKFAADNTIKCSSPCYEWKAISVHVKNHFQTSGVFKVFLVESSTLVTSPTQLKKSGKVPRNINYGGYESSGGFKSTDTFSPPPPSLKTSIKSSFIKEFFCFTFTVNMETKGSAILNLIFLPFNVHMRYCVIILSNEKIGELVYIIEGEGLIPLPCNFFPSSSSDDSNGSPDEVPSTEDSVVYLNCKAHQTVDAELKLPLVNEAKEKALAFAAQQQMSDLEFMRRFITGTLESSSVRVAVAILGLTAIETCMLFNTSKLRKPKSILYMAEASLPEYFKIPKKIYIPQISETSDKPQGIESSNKKAAQEYVTFSLRFAPINPGRYPCKIVLTSRFDVRVYYIEGVVNYEEAEAKIEFDTPAFEPLTQNIPITNDTMKHWKCHVTIQGDWFDGPPVIFIDPAETVQYPLTFKPILECEITGKVIVRNEVDGMQHIFDIRGIGRKPQALEHIIIDCKVGDLIHKTIMLPRFTKTAMTYTVTSDLPMVWGNPTVSLNSETEVPYVLHIAPWKRGIFKGAVTFNAQSQKEVDSQKKTDPDYSIEKSILDLSKHVEEKPDGKIKNLKIWYFVEVHSSPGPPINVIEMRTIALETVNIDLPFLNPHNSIVHLDVILSSEAFSGLKKLTMNPQECINYVVRYSPATTGYTEESIIFQPDETLEFWFLLRINTGNPKSVMMPELQCELGKYITQTISLTNPTHETLEVEISNSNSRNFVLDIYVELPLIVYPYSTTKVQFHFHPSSLGRATQQASINFHCAQFKEWIFFLCGVGLFPEPAQAERITTFVNFQTPVIVHFTNPTEEEVFINIILTNQEQFSGLLLDKSWDSFFVKHSSYRLTSLSHIKGIVVLPRGIFEIPVQFIPTSMKLYKTLVIIQMFRANGKYWPVDNFDELDTETKRMMRLNGHQVKAIHWIYPIIGLPQAPLPTCPSVVIKCQAKKRVEEVVEFALTGEFFGKNPTIQDIEFIVVPKRTPDDNLYDHVYEGIREFQYEIEFESKVMREYLESALALYLIKTTCQMKTQTITMIFNLVFTPMKPLRSQIVLKVECARYGIWRFPLTLFVTDPDVDDIINIEGIGLFKEAKFELRMTSQTRNSELFTAYFLPGSDPEFSVEPETGKLPPSKSAGALIKVGFLPQMYSRKYKATLVIQTANMYWLFEVNGLPQRTMPPRNVPAKVDSSNKTFEQRIIHRRNFIRENAKVLSTGVSSTIKGAPLTSKNK